MQEAKIQSSSESPIVANDAVPWMPGIIEDHLGGAGACDGEVEEVQSDFDRGHETGFAQGLLEGAADGRRLERESLASLGATLNAILDDVSERQDEWLATLDENLAALAVGIARQIIGREIAESREAVVDLVRRGLTEFPIGQAVSIRLNPEDLTLLSDASGDETTTRDEVRWIADPRIEPGGCVIEGPDRVVDGRVDRALERVYRALSDV